MQSTTFSNTGIGFSGSTVGVTGKTDTMGCLKTVTVPYNDVRDNCFRTFSIKYVFFRCKRLSVKEVKRASVNGARGAGLTKQDPAISERLAHSRVLPRRDSQAMTPTRRAPLGDSPRF